MVEQEQTTLDEAITIPVTASLKDSLERAAKREGMKLATYARRVLARDASDAQPDPASTIPAPT